MKKIKTTLRHIEAFLLKHLRILIALMGLVSFFLLWWQAHSHDPSTVNGGLLVNLTATALTVAFSALLIDWLHERRQRFLLAWPLKAAKHDLGSNNFMIGLILGKPYLANFATILGQFTQESNSGMDGLANIRKNLLNSLKDLTPASCPLTSLELAQALVPQIMERVTSIDETLRLYGFALDSELRDSTYVLRDRLIGLRNTLQSFELNGQLQHETAMQELVALGVKGVAEAASTMEAEWVQIGEQ